MADNVQDLREQYEDAQRAVQATEAELAATQAEMNRIHEMILELDARMISATEDLQNIEQALFTTMAALELAEQDWLVAQEELEHQHEVVRTRLRDIQEQGSMGLLSVVLRATSLRDFLLRVEYVNNIARRDQAMMAQLETNEARVARMQAEYTRHLSSVTALQNRQEEYIQRLEAMEAEQEAFFRALVADEASYMALLAFEQEHAATMHAQWTEAYEARQAQLALEAQERERRQQEARIIAVQSLGGIFTWPVPSSGDISSGFGHRPHPIRRTREHHDGIDIRATHGSDIVAAYRGTVILSGWHGGYGYTVIIDHGGGLHTLYGHNSRNLVSVGDFVEQGQLIARIGSTGVSTGPHLHFEVRVNGQPDNPGPWLGL